MFRYPGQSARIKFGDLRAMLDEETAGTVALADAAGRIADVGTSNALILDTEKNVLDAHGHSILIDEKLAQSINFVKEGQFSSDAGAPTLRLVGEVSSLIDASSTKPYSKSTSWRTFYFNGRWISLLNMFARSLHNQGSGCQFSILRA